MLKFTKDGSTFEGVQFDGTPGGACKVFETFDLPEGRFHPFGDLSRGNLIFKQPDGSLSVIFEADWILRSEQTGAFLGCSNFAILAVFQRVRCQCGSPATIFYDNAHYCSPEHETIFTRNERVLGKLAEVGGE